jgi:ATP-dependent Clp protease ATP-binding subunit ClpA
MIELCKKAFAPMLDMEKLSPAAKRVVQLTQEVLYAFEQNQFDNEHLLQALLEEEQSSLHAVARQQGLESSSLQATVEKHLRQRPKATPQALQSGQVYMTPRFSHLFSVAEKQVKRLGDAAFL